MSYVMVPVPEEFVDKVKRFLRYGLADALPQGAGDLDVVADVMAELDPLGQRLVALVADAASDQRELSLGESAQVLGRPEAELIGKAQEVSWLIHLRGGPFPAMQCLAPSGDDEEPSSRWRNRTWAMSKEVAAQIAGPRPVELQPNP